MARKWFIVLPLVVVELALCAGILAVFWGSYRWVQDNGLRITAFTNNSARAEADETQTLPVTGPATLTLENSSGAVTITGGAGSEVVISAHKTAWDATQAEAEASLAGLKVSITQTGNAITVKVTQPAEVALVGVKQLGRVDFTITLPADTTLDIHTDFGDVTAEGVNADVDLSTSAGAVTASEVSGAAVSLRSGFGDVTLEHAEAGTVDAGTNSGAVRLSQVTATGAVTLDTDFGNVRFEDGAADRLTATTTSGGVTLRDLTVSGAVEARSDFGSLTVEQVAAGGGYDLTTNSGAVTLTGAAGSVVAESGFGDVTITEAEAVTLNVHTSSGGLTFAGSLGAGPHSLRSDFGDIVLRLPPDAAASFDLGTDFGSIHSDFPVTVSGDLDATRWQGTLGGGGPRLTVHTSSGSIRLEILAA